MASPEAIAAAERVIGPVLVENLKEHIAQGGLLGQVGTLASELVFDRVWGRPGLSNHMRSLVTLGVLLARGRVDILRFYTRIAMNNGVTREELEEFLIQALPYIGFPGVVEAAGPMREMMAAVEAEQAQS
jgi:alkylhydroperoxidase/carboxymuconolactone decarboxylase family protein YurZ